MKVDLCLPHGITFGQSIPALNKHLKFQNALIAFVSISILINLLFFSRIQTVTLRNITDIIKEPYEAIEKAGVRNAIVFTGTLFVPPWSTNVWLPKTNSPDLSGSIYYLCP